MIDQTSVHITGWIEWIENISGADKGDEIWRTLDGTYFVPREKSGSQFVGIATEPSHNGVCPVLIQGIRVGINDAPNSGE